MKLEIEVIGEMPYYVPIPEGVALQPSLIGAEQFTISFSHFQPPRHPDNSQGTNVDDRIGTFLRSKAIINFPLNKTPTTDYPEIYEDKALSITNKVLMAIRYIVFDHTVRTISHFDKCSVRLADLSKDTDFIEVKTTHKESYGPFGVRIRGTLSEKALQNFWWVFNELVPINPAIHLLLDSKYHNSIGDLSRSILDLAIALEINIEGLIEKYSEYSSDLQSVNLDEKSIYTMYDSLLSQLTGHSLHEWPNLFIALEYIRGVRNSIAHTWTPEFRLTKQMRKNSRYIENHIEKDGHLITDKEEVSEMLKDAKEIIDITTNLFDKVYSHKI